MIEENKSYKDLSGNVYRVLSIEKMDEFARHNIKDSLKVQVVCTEGPHEGKVRFIGLKLMEEMIAKESLIEQSG